MSLEIEYFADVTRRRALIFSLSSLRELAWVGKNCDRDAYFTELERFMRDATRKTPVEAPAIVMPKRHLPNFCKIAIHAHTLSTGYRALILERGDHGAFCGAAKKIQNAIKAYRYYKWLRRQRNYPNRERALDHRFTKATTALSRARREIQHILKMTLTTLNGPDVPKVVIPPPTHLANV